MTDDFHGFPPETTRFLADLRRNNDKAWFDRHRSTYDDHLIAPAKAFVVAAGEALRTLSSTIVAEPRVNGSILRINRDIRFSRDKTPYKQYLDFWFWDGAERKQAVTGYHVRITPKTVRVGVGARRFDADQLARHRSLVVHPRKGKELVEAVAAVEKAGFDVQGEHYKRPPKGFEEPTDAVRSRLLRCNALWADGQFDVPASLASRRFVSWCMTRWAKQQPLHEWLRANVQQR